VRPVKAGAFGEGPEFLASLTRPGVCVEMRVTVEEGEPGCFVMGGSGRLGDTGTVEPEARERGVPTRKVVDV
jgi:hypothetical protein